MVHMVGRCDNHAYTLYSWRRMRRAAHEALAKTVLQRYYPIQTKEATILVLSLLTPSVSLNPDKQFQRLTASTIMSIVYDLPTIVSEHDHTVKQIEEFNGRISEAALPGAHFVDIFPWMVHIPERSWFISVIPMYIVLTHDYKIREMEARRFETIYEGLRHVQKPS